MLPKHWWIQALCLAIAAGPTPGKSAEAPVVAKSVAEKSTAENRSRLLVFSRKPTVPLTPEQPPRKPNGNTGTFSPQSGKATGATVNAGQGLRILSLGGTNPAPTDAAQTPLTVPAAPARTAPTPARTPSSSGTMVRSFPARPAAPQTLAATETELDLERERALFEEPLGTTPHVITPRNAGIPRVPPEFQEPENREEMTADELLEDLKQQNRYLEMMEAQADETAPTTPRTTHRTSPRTPVLVDENPFEEEGTAPRVQTAAHADPPATSRRVQPVSQQVQRPVAAPITRARTATTPRTAATDTPLTETTPAAAPPVAVLPKRTSSAPRPSAVQGSPQVSVQWVPRGEINLGQECRCALVVKNTGRVVAQELTVEAEFPASAKLVDAQPIPQSTGSKLEWQIAELDVGEERTIELTMIPTDRGELAANASIRFTGTAQTSFKVAEPLLTVEANVPGVVQLGEQAGTIVRVTNPGTGTARNVTVQAQVVNANTKAVQTAIGSLGPGESRTVRLPLPTTAGGEHQIQIVAHSPTGNLTANTAAKLTVIAPTMQLQVHGPALRYPNRPAKYVLNATNTSRAASDNVRIVEQVPAGIDFLQASSGGMWEPNDRTVTWYLGRVEPGQTIAIELEVMPRELGNFEQQFELTADAGVRATQLVETRVEGAASLTMRVSDLEDPVEVGVESGYEIRVRNTGSKAASKVGIACELPAEAELVRAEGPARFMVENGLLIFKQIEELPAGEEAVFRVIMRGTTAGSSRLRARLTSESIQKPLIVEEATEFYGE